MKQIYQRWLRCFLRLAPVAERHGGIGAVGELARSCFDNWNYDRKYKELDELIELVVCGR